MAIVVVSSEEEELMTVADTIVAFRSGTCDGVTFRSVDVTPAQLRELAWSHVNEGTSQSA